MAGPIPALRLDMLAFCESLLQQHSLQARARRIARHLGIVLRDCAVVVYLLGAADDAEVWVAKASAGDIEVAASTIPRENRLGLGMMLERGEAIVFSALSLRRELYSHLNIRRTFLSLAYLPLMNGSQCFGAIEIACFDSELDSHALAALHPLVDLAAIGLWASIDYEQEQRASLASVARLTQLYDLEKTFSSTLEMDELLPIIGSKSREVLDCRAVNIWLIQPDESLLLVHQSGSDPTSSEGEIQRPGEGLAGDVSDSGEALLIDSAEDERLRARNAAMTGGAISSVMLAPLMHGGALVGVLEAVDRNDCAAFSEDHLFALTHVAAAASGALHNASLLLAERKVEVLETLVKVSTTITSTLDLDRVLQAVVNGPATVIPYERAAIALQQRGRFQLRAISGQPEFDSADPQIKPLQELLQWATLSGEPLLVRRRNGSIESESEESRAKFAAYFDATGMEGFHAVPLMDEEGKVGMLSFESSNPDFLGEAHLEMIKVLAAQATVSVRNASLYREVPFINVLEPLLQQKQRFLAMHTHRRAALLGVAAAAVLFLCLFPLPYRVEGEARVSPIHRAQIQPQVEGVIRQVFVHEGDVVQQGSLIAEMQDGEFRAAIAAARARLAAALGSMDRALSTGDATEAGILRNEAEFWSAEVARAEERLQATRILSPIDGVVTTPHIEDFSGKRLQFGDRFAEVINSAETSVDVSVDEHDIALLRNAEKAWIKLDAFPDRTFQGTVAVISPDAEVEGDERVFFARVVVPNPARLLRAGMQGRGKVMTGWRPAGAVIFRRFGIAIWTKLWSMFGW